MTLKKKLLEILLSLPNTQDRRQRDLLITNWELGCFSKSIDYSGANDVFFNELITILLPQGKDFILNFIDKVSNSEYTGLELREQLKKLKNRIEKIAPENWPREFIEDVSPNNFPIYSESTLESYLKRQDIQSQCCQEILKPGAFLQIKASRYMGKTFLAEQIIKQAKQHNYYGVRLPFELVKSEQETLETLELFLKWFCRVIALELNDELYESGIQLKLLYKVEDNWDNTIGQKLTCRRFFERNILSKINRPLILCLDDIDKIFEQPHIIHDFFGLLREWSQRATDKKNWKKLRLILTYSKPFPPHESIYESPSNLGTFITLQDFTQEEIYNLVSRDKLNWNMRQVEKLRDMIGGYPFLVGKALQHISSRRTNLDEFLKTAPTDNGIYAGHLKDILRYLQKHSKLLQIMRVIVETPIQIDDYDCLEEIHELESMGLIVGEDKTRKIRCLLYQTYLKNNL